MTSEVSAPWHRVLQALGLFGICLLGFALRAAGFEWVFVGDDEVALKIGDGQYNARLALATFLRFPNVLSWDPLLNYPAGAQVQPPPLFALLVASLAKAFGGSLASLERVLAWMSPVAGGLAPIPVYFAARRLRGTALGLGSAALLACFPVAVISSRVGDADHHGLLQLFGAASLALCLAAVAPGVGTRRAAALGAALAAARLGMALLWSGSLLYLGLIDASLLLVGALSGRRPLLAFQALGAGVAGLALLPLVAQRPPPLGGAFSAIALSYLQVVWLLTVALVAGSLALAEGWRASRRPTGRLVRLAAASGVALLALALLPGFTPGLLAGLDFLAGTAEGNLSATQELLPLLPGFGRPAAQPPALLFGAFTYLVPFAFLAPLLLARNRDRRDPSLVLAGWTLVLGLLALRQARYANELGPALAIATALALATLGRFAERRSRVSRSAVAVSALLAVAGLWVPISLVFVPSLHASVRALSGSAPPGDRALATPHGSMIRFLQKVRIQTPETAGFFGDGVPEYGILTPANLGHALHHVARRASPIGGFQYLLDAETWAQANRFYATEFEAEGLAIARQLRSTYVVTYHFPGKQPRSIDFLLQEHDGNAAESAPRLEHFRLVTEGPAGGVPMGDQLGLPRPDRVVPYKLFEIVPGAQLEVTGEPEALVVARLGLRAPTGRRFSYEARGTVAADGVARLRVPYATSDELPVRSIGSYRVRVGEQIHRVDVPDAAVSEGEVVHVGSTPEPAGEAGRP